MSWWRKTSPTDTGAHNIDDWVQIKSIWRKTSEQDAANSEASQNPWVVDGWLKIKSAWRLNSIVSGLYTWVKIFAGSDLPTPQIPYPDLYFVWPDGFETIDAPINGSKMFGTRGSWTEDPTEFRIRIQGKDPLSDWSTLFDYTKTYTEYLETDSYDRFPSNSNSSQRPTISKAQTREGYKFRLIVNVKAGIDPDTGTALENSFYTDPLMPRMDFYTADFSVYDEVSDGASFLWTYAAIAPGNTVNDSLDIFSQKINVYDEFEETLILSQTIPVGTTIYNLSSPLLEPNTTYVVELEVIGKDGHSETAEPTYDYAYVDLITIVDEPENLTPPTLELQDGEENKTGSTYRLSSGTWTNDPTEYRYQIELNDQQGTVLAYYPSGNSIRQIYILITRL